MPVAMAFKDEINYEKISQINKLERKSSKLTILDPEFYDVLIKHLKKLQEEYNKKYLEAPTSTEALLLNNEICKLDNIIKEIYTRRERKIILSALDTNSKPNFRQMLEHEQKLYEVITNILDEYRNDVLNDKAKPTCVEPPTSEEATPIEPDSEPDTVTESQAQTPTEEIKPESATNDQSEDDALILVLEEIEPFVGTDLVTYNLHKEDLVTVPKSIAEILTKNNKVKLIEPTI